MVSDYLEITHIAVSRGVITELGHMQHGVTLIRMTEPEFRRLYALGVRFRMKWLGLDNEVYVDDGTPVTPPTIATRMDSPFNRKLFKLPRYLETVPCRVQVL